MTVEIAVINREAVALAADSAVTIGSERHKRVFESAQKLFQVSDEHAVGLMVYNNGLFMGIPVETIVAMYRASLLKTGKLKTLREYADEMIRVLNGLVTRVPREAEELYIDRALGALLQEICGEIRRKTETEEAQAVGTTAKRGQIGRVTWRVASRYLQRIASCRDSSVPKGFEAGIRATYGSLIQDTVAEVLEENGVRLSRSSSAIRALNEIGTSFFIKNTDDFFIDRECVGLVIAGVGEEEIFPSVITMHIRGGLQQALLYHEVAGSSCSMGFDTPADIIGFARDDVIQAVKYGVWPDYIDEITNRMNVQCFESFMSSVPSIMRLVAPSQNVKRMEKRLVRVSSGIFSRMALDFELSVEDDREEADREWDYLISMLPSSELAEVARTLVRFTCFYWRYRETQATVKEPVRVAVISKNEGFRWVE